MKINLIKLVLKLMQLNKHRTSESIIIKIKFIKATWKLKIFYFNEQIINNLHKFLFVVYEPMTAG